MKVECWGFSYRISLEWLFSHTWKNRVRNDLFWMIPLRQNSHWDSHSQRARRKWNQVGMLKTREFTQQTVLIDGRFSKPPKCFILWMNWGGCVGEGPNSHVASSEAMARSQYYSLNSHFFHINRNQRTQALGTTALPLSWLCACSYMCMRCAGLQLLNKIIPVIKTKHPALFIFPAFAQWLSCRWGPLAACIWNHLVWL